MLTISGVLVALRSFPPREGMPGQDIGNVEGVNVMLRPEQAVVAKGLVGQTVTVTGFGETNKYGFRLLASAFSNGSKA